LAEIERASSELEKHKAILKDFGIDYSETTSNENTSHEKKAKLNMEPVEEESKKRKSHFFSFFRKEQQ